MFFQHQKYIISTGGMKKYKNFIEQWKWNDNLMTQMKSAALTNGNFSNQQIIKNGLPLKINEAALTLLRTGGKKAPPTSFSPVTSTNVGCSPQNFLTFSFNSFATMLQILVPVPNYWTWTKSIPGQILIKLRFL